VPILHYTIIIRIIQKVTGRITVGKGKKHMTNNAQQSKDILAFFLKSSHLFISKNVDVNLTPREIKLLYLLTEPQSSQGVPVGDLSKKMELTLPATSKLLKNLEAKKMLVRKPLETDRRVIIVYITELGREKLRSRWEEFCTNIELIVSNLGEENTNAFIALSKKFIEALDRSGFNMNTKSE